MLSINPFKSDSDPIDNLSSLNIKSDVSMPNSNLENATIIMTGSISKDLDIEIRNKINTIHDTHKI